MFLLICACFFLIAFFFFGTVTLTNIPKKCPTCNKVFKTKQGLKYHQSLRKNYECHRKFQIKKRLSYKANKKGLKVGKRLHHRVIVSLYKKHPKGQGFDASHKQTCVNVFQGLIDRGFDFHTAKKEAANLLGVPVVKLGEFIKEKHVHGGFKSNASQFRQKKDLFEKLTSFQKYGIQRHVHNEFKSVKADKMHPYVTINRLHLKLKDDDSIPKMSTSTLAKVLRLLGFRYQANDELRNSMLLEKDEIVDWRRM